MRLSLKVGKKLGVNYTIIGRVFWYRMEFCVHCKSQTSQRDFCRFGVETLHIESTKGSQTNNVKSAW